MTKDKIKMDRYQTAAAASAPPPATSDANAEGTSAASPTTDAAVAKPTSRPTSVINSARATLDRVTEVSRPHVQAAYQSASATVERISAISAHPNAQATTKFLSAYTKTWLGMSPIWLMGEALVPGAKFGGQFMRGATEMQLVVADLQKAVSATATDVLVVIDTHLKSASTDTAKTAEVLKAAGDNALVIVSTSIEKAHDQIKRSTPEIQASVKRHGKDCVVIVDKTLKHPLVITGITKFARSQGVPQPEALLRIASLGLSKLAAALEDPEDDDGPRIVELDADDLRTQSSSQAAIEAEAVGKAGDGPPPRVETAESGPPPPAVPVGDAATAKKGGCLIA